MYKPVFSHLADFCIGVLNIFQPIYKNLYDPKVCNQVRTHYKRLLVNSISLITGNIKVRMTKYPSRHDAFRESLKNQPSMSCAGNQERPVGSLRTRLEISSVVGRR